MTKNGKRYVIGIDTGGTFTDSVAIDEIGRMWRAKALSQPLEFEKGIIASLERLAENIGIQAGQLLNETTAFCFGTTVGTNTLWTRTGAKVGLLITRGFEDTHHIARGLSKWAGLPEAEIKHISALRKSEPLLSKEEVVGIDERVDWTGNIICPLNRKMVKDAAEALMQKGVESVAICYLWSIRNAEHEIETSRIISELYPHIYNTYSSRIMPSEGEYERFNNAIIDAYIGPVTAKFLCRLDEILKDRGLKCDMMTMKADGGSALISEAVPLATIHSGPAAGVLCAKFIGQIIGYQNIITADVGGTSFDNSVIAEGKLLYSREPTLEKFSVSCPSLDVKSIGAGGGSIARVEPVTKTLEVGPKSAGAYPGPACYGFGGTEATVTDANLVLGYLNPDFFLGGKMKLYPDKAFEVIEKLSKELNMSVTATAAGIYRVINGHCTDLVRAATVEKGFDPRDFVLFVFGGCGPVHAVEWAADLGVKAVVISPFASEYSALGMAVADTLHTEFQYDYAPIPMDVDRFNGNFEMLEQRVLNKLDKEGVRKEKLYLSYFIRCKYPTVYGYTRVPLARKKYQATDMGKFISKAFDTEYERVYGTGSGMVKAGREIVGFEVHGLAPKIKPPIPENEVKGPDANGALKGKRDAYFPALKKFISTDIYVYSKLATGNIIVGSAIIEATDTTVVIPPGSSAEVDKYLNIVVKTV